ncbi:MAG: hypothetical protein ACO1NM_06080 [Sphingobium phenoxybenzoativorans]
MSPLRILILAALLLASAAIFWLWWTDWLLKRDCADAQGKWDATARTCLIDAKTYRVPG